MAHVTIIAKGYTEKEIIDIKTHYKSMGFDVDVVRDMNNAVKGVMQTLRDW